MITSLRSPTLRVINQARKELVGGRPNNNKNTNNKILIASRSFLSLFQSKNEPEVVIPTSPAKQPLYPDPMNIPHGVLPTISQKQLTPSFLEAIVIANSKLESGNISISGNPLTGSIVKHDQLPKLSEFDEQALESTKRRTLTTTTNNHLENEVLKSYNFARNILHKYQSGNTFYDDVNIHLDFARYYNLPNIR